MSMSDFKTKGDEHKLRKLEASAVTENIQYKEHHNGDRVYRVAFNKSTDEQGIQELIDNIEKLDNGVKKLADNRDSHTNIKHVIVD